MDFSLISLVLLITTLDATAASNIKLHTRKMVVEPLDNFEFALKSKTNIRSAVECAAECEKEKCLSLTYTKADRRCDFYSSFTDAAMNKSTSYFVKDPVFKSCIEVPSGSPSGVYLIQTAEGKLRRIFCDMVTPDGPWTVVQRKSTSQKISFYQPWEIYKRGFGDLQGDFWIGNELLFMLTQTPTKLRVVLEFADGTTKWAQYAHFRVASEVAKYRLGISGFSGTLTIDALGSHDSYYFTTFDEKNSGDDCQLSFMQGWWYGGAGCYFTSLNDWQLSWSQYDTTLKKAKMMLRW